MAEVVLVRWPDQRAEASELTELGVAVLYLLGDEDDPPMPTTCLEDWVRVPGDERDLQARVAALEFRASLHDSLPSIDRHGLLRYRGQLLVLPPPEARIMTVLVDHFGDVVTDSELTEATLHAAAHAEPSLRARVTHLRRRLREVGLVVRRISGCGYRLQRAEGQRVRASGMSTARLT